jgi:hypothetical protein
MRLSSSLFEVDSMRDVIEVSLLKPNTSQQDTSIKFEMIYNNNSPPLFSGAISMKVYHYDIKEKYVQFVMRSKNKDLLVLPDVEN